MKKRLLAFFIATIIFSNQVNITAFAENDSGIEESFFDGEEFEEEVLDFIEEGFQDEVADYVEDINLDSAVPVLTMDCSKPDTDSNVQLEIYKNEDGEDTYTMSFSGTGAIKAYLYSDESVKTYKNKVTKVLFSDGITEISNYDFNGFKKITGVQFSDTIKIINDNSFEGCESLSKITIPANCERVGNSTFAGCSNVTEIDFSKATKVTFIGSDAFKGTAITEIQLPDSLESVNGFYSCNKLTSVSFGANVDVINSEAFSYCTSLKVINFPSKLTKIGSYAFAGTGLEKVVLSEKVDTLGSRAFSNCSGLKEVDISQSRIGSYDGCFDGCPLLKEIIFPETFRVIEGGFTDNTTLEKISLPYGMTTICSEAFKYCESLRTLTIPATVTSIGNDAFYCLRQEELPFDPILDENGKRQYLITLKVNENSYAHNYAIENDIPFELIIEDEFHGKCGASGDDVSWILTQNADGSQGEQAYTLTISGEGNIRNFNKISDTPWFSVLVDTNETDDGKDSYVSRLVIEDGITGIGANAFAYFDDWCHSDEQGIAEQAGKYIELSEKLVLPDSVKEMSYFSFSSCSFLKGIQLSSDLEKFGRGCFYKATINSDINIPASAKEFDESIFNGAKIDGDINLPTNFKEIPKNFLACANITGSLNNVEKIEKINDYAFDKCIFTNGYEFRFSDNLKYIGRYAFEESNITGSYIFPDSVEYIGDFAFSNSSFGGNLVLPQNEKFTKINVATFEKTSLSSPVFIPDNVTSICNSAFFESRANDDRIEFYVPKSVVEIGYNAFSSGYEGIYRQNILWGANDSAIKKYAECYSLEKVKFSCANYFYYTESGSTGERYQHQFNEVADGDRVQIDFVDLVEDGNGGTRQVLIGRSFTTKGGLARNINTDSYFKNSKYKCASWYKESKPDTVFDFSTETVTENLTLICKKIKKDHIVLIDSEGNELDAEDGITLHVGESTPVYIPYLFQNGTLTPVKDLVGNEVYYPNPVLNDVYYFVDKKTDCFRDEEAVGKYIGYTIEKITKSSELAIGLVGLKATEGPLHIVFNPCLEQLNNCPVYIPLTVLPAEQGVNYRKPASLESSENFLTLDKLTAEDAVSLPIWDNVRKSLWEENSASLLLDETSFNYLKNMEEKFNSNQGPNWLFMYVEDFYSEREGAEGWSGDYMFFHGSLTSYVLDEGLPTTFINEKKVYYLPISLNTSGYNYDAKNKEPLVKTFVDNLLAPNGALYSVNNDQTSDLEKIKAAYDWVLTNVKYESGYNSNMDSFYYFAYTGFYEGKGSCECMAQCFYYICRELGVDVRILFNSNLHVLNMVRVDEKWYFVDCSAKKLLKGKKSLPYKTNQYILPENCYDYKVFKANYLDKVPEWDHENASTITYKIKFNKNASNAKGTMADTTVVGNAQADVTNKFTRPYGENDQYTFKYWTLTAKDTDDPTKRITGNVFKYSPTKNNETITLYAQWQGPAKDVIFDLPEGVSLSSTYYDSASGKYKQTVYADDKIGDLPVPTKAGNYKFSGWYLRQQDNSNSLGQLVDSNLVVCENLVLHPEFVPMENLNAPVVAGVNGTLVPDDAGNIVCQLNDSLFFTNDNKGAEIYYKVSDTDITDTAEVICGSELNLYDSFTNAKTLLSSDTNGDGKLFIRIYAKKDSVISPAASVRSITVVGLWGDVESSQYFTEIKAKYPNANNLPESAWTYMPVKEAVYSMASITEPGEKMEVYYNNIRLVNKKDYKLIYANNKNVGMAKVTVKLIGNYSGQLSREFEIKPRSLNKANQIFVYYGNEEIDETITVPLKKSVQKIKPVLKLYNSKTKKYTALKAGTDYTIEYPTTAISGTPYKDIGLYDIDIQGINNFASETKLNLKLKITDTNDLAFAKVTYSDSLLENPDGEPNLNVVVKMGKKVLKEGPENDYIIEKNVINDTNANGVVDKYLETGKFTVKGVNNYSGKQEDFFYQINRSGEFDGSGLSATMPATVNENYDFSTEGIKKVIYSNLVVMDGDTVVQPVRNIGDTNCYEIKNLIIPAKAIGGLYEFDICGNGKYNGQQKHFKFKIKNPYNIALTAEGRPVLTCELVAGEDTQYQCGAAVAPAVVVKLGSIELEKNVDYTISYTNNKNVNQSAKIKITGKGKYKGAVTFTNVFTITVGKGCISGTAKDAVYTAKPSNFKTSLDLVYRYTNANNEVKVKSLKQKTDYEPVSEFYYAADSVVGTKVGKTIEYKRVGANTKALSTDIVMPGTTMYVKPVLKDSAKDKYGTNIPEKVYYRVAQINIAKAKVSVLASSYDYNGKQVVVNENDIKAVYNNTVLTANDFEVVSTEFVNSVKAGTAKVTIRGLGLYGGTKTITYKIKAKSFNYEIVYNSGDNLPNAKKMKTIYIPNGGKLSKCTFKAPAGMQFGGWTIYTPENQYLIETPEYPVEKPNSQAVFTIDEEAYPPGSTINLYPYWKPAN